MQLSDGALRALDPRLRPPTYDRRALRPAVVHIGVGAFHRAHQLVYLDELARSGELGWGETGVGLRSTSMREALAPQDGLYTVLERCSSTESATVVGAMGEYLYGPQQSRAVLARLAHRDTRLVTLTVTGDGYAVGVPGSLDDGTLDRPRSWSAYVVAALAQRRAAGLVGFTVLSCDNLPRSGPAAKAAVVGFAAQVDETLARWIERNATFPSAMVDRITPATDDALARSLRADYGLIDRAPVLTEPFRQWVIEDDFAAGRPPLDDVGVQFVSDVAPYKLVKSRLLNGTHSALAYLGYLAGLRTTAQVAADPVLGDFVTQVMRYEIAPLLPSVPGMDLADYQSTLLARFGNEHVGDELARLCGRGSTKVPAYLIPSLFEARRAGAAAPLLTLAVAAWFRYLRGHDLEGRLIEIRDVRRDELTPLALAGRNDPGPLLGARDVMGPLGEDLGLRRDLGNALNDLERWGVREAVRRRLGAQRPAALWSAQRSEDVLP